MIHFSPPNGLPQSIPGVFVISPHGGPTTINALISVNGIRLQTRNQLNSGLPDYYFNQFDPRSPFYEPSPDSYDWHDSFTDPNIHHDTDPFDSY